MDNLTSGEAKVLSAEENAASFTPFTQDVKLNDEAGVLSTQHSALSTPNDCSHMGIFPDSVMRHDPIPRLFKSVEQAFRTHALNNLRVEGIDDVFPGSMPLILHLADEDGLTMSELGKRCGLENSTLTPLVDELARRNIARRVRDDEDRRVIRLYLTDYGQSLAPRLKTILLRLQEVAMANISERDLAVMRAVLEAILANLEAAHSNTNT